MTIEGCTTVEDIEARLLQLSPDEEWDDLIVDNDDELSEAVTRLLSE